MSDSWLHIWMANCIVVWYGLLQWKETQVVLTADMPDSWLQQKMVDMVINCHRTVLSLISWRKLFGGAASLASCSINISSISCLYSPGPQRCCRAVREPEKKGSITTNNAVSLLYGLWWYLFCMLYHLFSLWINIWGVQEEKATLKLEPVTNMQGQRGQCSTCPALQGSHWWNKTVEFLTF